MGITGTSTILNTTRADDRLLLVGESPAITGLRREIQDAARTRAKVLILGETGVGKEVVARQIHAGGARSGRAIVAVNCSGIPETLLESELFGHTRGSFTGAYRDKPGLVRQADGGTLFLDELGEMSPRMQAVLLRFTETGEIQPVGADRPAGRADVRLITATNRDLRAQIADGKFREDLYYRLNVIQIRIPPLRDRAGDVTLLLRHFLQQASEAHRMACPELTRDAQAVLEAYPWPGNVRELKNITERLVVRELGRPVGVDDLPAELLRSPAALDALGGMSGMSGIAGASGASRIAVPGATPAASSTESSLPPVMSSIPSRGDSAFVSPQDLGAIVGEPSPIVEVLWRRLMDGESFWAIAEMYKNHDITRADLRVLIHRGLQRTRGNYRALLRVFNLPLGDYKRFQAFLFQHKCNLPFRFYRSEEAAVARSAGKGI